MVDSILGKTHVIFVHQVHNHTHKRAYMETSTLGITQYDLTRKTCLNAGKCQSNTKLPEQILKQRVSIHIHIHMGASSSIITANYIACLFRTRLISQLHYNQLIVFHIRRVHFEIFAYLQGKHTQQGRCKGGQRSISVLRWCHFCNYITLTDEPMARNLWQVILYRLALPVPARIAK